MHQEPSGRSELIDDSLDAGRVRIHLAPRPPVLSMELVTSRAVGRGEVAATAVAPRILAVPFDFFRNEVLMTLEAVPTDTIR